MIVRKCVFLNMERKVRTGHIIPLYWCDYHKIHVCVRDECRKCTVQEWVEVD